MTQFHAEHSPLQAVHTVVKTQLFMPISPGLGVVPQRSDPGGDSIVIGGDRPSFSIGTEILTRIETETPDPPDRPRPAAMVHGAMRLSGIFDQR